MSMSLSEELEYRGFVNQTTVKDLSYLDKHKPKFYHGYDGSDDSLTIGNLAAVMLDRCFIRHGVKAVALVGGATSLIGDPGGKTSERDLKPEDKIEQNVHAIKLQLKHLLGTEGVEYVNNLDWIKDMTVVEFLRDVGKHFSMTPLVQRDYIASRMGEGGSGISYAEFSYSLLQGYDFLYLFEHFGVKMQISGADQWGNSLSGVELIRKVKNESADVFTCPLIVNKATGVKFGKSESGAIWLDSKKTSPQDFYQFWISCPDDAVEGYLKIFTELSKDEIESVIRSHNSDPSKRIAQTALAKAVTEIVHPGESAKAVAHAKALVNLTDEAPAELVKNVKKEDLPKSIVEILFETGLASSKSEARRLVVSGAVYINDEPFGGEALDREMAEKSPLRLRKGKSLSNTIIIKID